MKPNVLIATSKTPAGEIISLYEHDGDYAIYAGRTQLMNSRENLSELELARLGCARIASHRAPCLLVGGLGMGYTLRQALDMLPPLATVVVAELLPEVVRWNRDIIGHLTNHPLNDKRVTLKIGNVIDVLRNSPNTFDAILLDIDNGPEAVTTLSNQRLYSPNGIKMCIEALHSKGCLSIWSASEDKRFEFLLRRQRMHLRAFPVAARTGAKRLSRCIWVSSRDPHSVPEPEPFVYHKRRNDKSV